MAQKLVVDPMGIGQPEGFSVVGHQPASGRRAAIA